VPSAALAPVARFLLRVTLVAGLLAGCATLPGAPVRDDALARERIDALREVSRSRMALTGVARMAVDADRGSVRGRYLLFLERPARLRVEILGLLNQTLAVLVTDEGRYDFFQVEDRSLESGSVYPDLLRDVSGVPLAPEQAVDLLLGAPLPDEGLSLRDSARHPNGVVVAHFANAGDMRRQRFEFDPAGRLRRLETRAVDGSMLWAASFDDYESIGDSAFAHEVVLVFPGSDTRARVRLNDIAHNPPHAPEAFVLKVPGG
jgi:outer membrane biogenesis lipoprotein LolB